MVTVPQEYASTAMVSQELALASNIGFPALEMPTRVSTLNWLTLDATVPPLDVLGATALTAIVSEELALTASAGFPALDVPVKLTSTAAWFAFEAASAVGFPALHVPESTSPMSEELGFAGSAGIPVLDLPPATPTKSPTAVPEVCYVTLILVYSI